MWLSLWMSRSIIHSTTSYKTKQMYILAVGCPNIKPPADAHVRRDGDKLYVVCNHTSETSQLTCVNNAWNGTPKNCSQGLSAEQHECELYQYWFIQFFMLLFNKNYVRDCIQAMNILRKSILNLLRQKICFIHLKYWFIFFLAAARLNEEQSPKVGLPPVGKNYTTMHEIIKAAKDKSNANVHKSNVPFGIHLLIA